MRSRGVAAGAWCGRGLDMCECARPLAKQDITCFEVRDPTMPHSAQNLEKCKNSTFWLGLSVYSEGLFVKEKICNRTYFTEKFVSLTYNLLIFLCVVCQPLFILLPWTSQEPEVGLGSALVPSSPNFLTITCLFSCNAICFILRLSRSVT